MTESDLLKRIRPWPDAVLSVPSVYVQDWQARDDGSIVMSATHWDRPLPNSRIVALPDELYLRELMQLNVDSAERIAEFCSRFGTLRLKDSPEFLDLMEGFLYVEPWYDLESAEDLQPYFEQWREIFEDEPRDEAAFAEGEEILRVFQATLAASRPEGCPIAPTFHADEFRLVAHELRDMTRILLALLGKREQYERGLEAAHIWRSQDFKDDVLWFLRSIDSGLKDLSPRLIFEATPESNTAANSPAQQVGLLRTSLCAQYFNAVVETPHVRKCILDTCSQEFVNQRGRSKKGGHRSNSLYCSASCARVASKRASRAKKRAERETGRPGKDAS